MAPKFEKALCVVQKSIETFFEKKKTIEIELMQLTKSSLKYVNFRIIVHIIIKI